VFLLQPRFRTCGWSNSSHVLEFGVQLNFYTEFNDSKEQLGASSDNYKPSIAHKLKPQKVEVHDLLRLRIWPRIGD
jgi:hypothetical protein